MENTKRLFNMLLIEGIFLAVLGLLIMLVPQFMSFAVAMLISIGLIIAGIYKLVSSIILRKEIENPWISVILGLLLVVTGVYMTARPIFSILMLTMAIGIYFIIDGINTLSVSIQNRGITKYWGVGILASLVQFLLAFLIIFGLPQTSLFIIGILIGVNMLFSGISMISIYTGGHKYLSEV